MKGCRLSLLRGLFALAATCFESVKLEYTFTELEDSVTFDEEGYGPFLNLKFALGQNDIHLRLFENDRIDPNPPLYFLGDTKTEIEAPVIEGVTFYQDPSNRALVSSRKETDGHDVYEGSFAFKKERYVLSEAAEGQGKTAFSRPNRLSNEVRKKYRYRLSKVREREQRPLEPPSSQEKEFISPKFHRPKRATDVTELRVDLVFVLDYSEWKYWLTEGGNDEANAIMKLKYYFAYMMNGMDLIYSSISGTEKGIRVSLALKEYHIAMSKAESNWTEGNILVVEVKDRDTIINADATLAAFGIWKDSKPGWGWSYPDHAMLWSRYNFQSGSNPDHIGLAYRAGICQYQRGASIIEDIGYDAFVVAAHELGHNLGAVHDGDNSCSAHDQYLMAPTNGRIGSLDETQLEKSFRFSPCSLDEIYNTVFGYNGIEGDTDTVPYFPRVCLRYSTSNESESGETIPYSFDEQCKTYAGENTQHCDTAKLQPAYICKQLYCTQPFSTLCDMRDYYSPAEGTNCSVNAWESKVCVKGRCVDTSTTTPATPVVIESSVTYNVPESCYKYNAPLNCLGWDCHCSDADVTTCSNNTNVKEVCCFFCKKQGYLNQTTVCNEDYGYSTSYHDGTASHSNVKCQDIIRLAPQYCLSESDDDWTRRFRGSCCVKCHRSGLAIATNLPLPTTNVALTMSKWNVCLSCTFFQFMLTHINIYLYMN